MFLITLIGDASKTLLVFFRFTIFLWFLLSAENQVKPEEAPKFSPTPNRRVQHNISLEIGKCISKAPDYLEEQRYFVNAEDISNGESAFLFSLSIIENSFVTLQLSPFVSSFFYETAIWKKF